MVDLPPDWRSPETARMTFREGWCRREGLDMQTCDHLPDAEREAPAHLDGAHVKYCGDNKVADCDAYFAALNERFKREWKTERKSTIDNLPKLDLTHRDLRRADAAGVSLVGADLTLARMEGAILWQARMEGAILSEARMEGADLRGARMEGAILRGARMEGANLWQARMEGAILRGARMEGADLRGARMEGANLWQARMEGADLTLARMEGANLRGARMEGAILWQARMEGANLRGARMEGAILGRADLRSANWAGASNRASPAQFADLRAGQDLTQAQLDQMIGNASTLLPDTLAPDTKAPYHIADCWASPPEGWDILVKNLTRDGPPFAPSEAELAGLFICTDNHPFPTGTRLPLDAPYPKGHPLAERN